MHALLPSLSPFHFPSSVFFLIFATPCSTTLLPFSILPPCLFLQLSRGTALVDHTHIHCVPSTGSLFLFHPRPAPPPPEHLSSLTRSPYVCFHPVPFFKASLRPSNLLGTVDLHIVFCRSRLCCLRRFTRLCQLSCSNLFLSSDRQNWSLCG